MSDNADQGWTRDDRYRFQGFPPDLLTGLGRLVLNSSYLEGAAAIVLARLICNSPDGGNLELGHRLTANATFPWLLDHIRAVSELKLQPDHHAAVTAWTVDARTAYAARSRIVHADWGVDVTGGTTSFFFFRHDARKKTFTVENWPATAAEIHSVAQNLERVGIAALELLGYIPRSATTDVV